MKNADFHSQDVKRCCENKLGIKFKKGGELNGWYRLGKMKVARITVPKGKKPIPPKTYKSMAGQLKLSVGEFDQLLECPLSREQYEEIVRSKT